MGSNYLNYLSEYPINPDRHSACYYYLDAGLFPAGNMCLETALERVRPSVSDAIYNADPRSYVQILANLLYFHGREFPDFSGMDDEEEDSSDGRKRKSKEIKYSRYTADHKSRVEICIQAYKSKLNTEALEPGETHRIAGWMFIFKICDEILDIDTEIARYFAELTRTRSKRARLTKDLDEGEETKDHLTICDRREDWFTVYLSRVVPELQSNANLVTANATDMNGMHPYALSRCFSKESALQRVRDAEPLPGYYLLSQHFMVRIRVFNKFNLAYIGRSNNDVDNEALNAIRLSENEREDRELGTEARPRIVADLADAFINLQSDLLKGCIAQVEETKRRLNIAQFERYLRSPDCKDFVYSYLSRDDYNPGRKVVLDWFLNEINEAHNNKKIYSIRPTKKQIGMFPKQTIFGNMVSRMLYKFDVLLRNHYNHEEQFLAFINTLAMYTFGADELRLHFIISGPPQSGKSFLWDKLNDICIPGYIKPYSLGSDKAHTTKSNWNMHMVLADEGPRDILKQDNDNGATGSAIIKTMFTSGIILAARAIVDEKTKEIVTNETACERKCMFQILMNPAFHCLAPALRSRVHKHHLPVINILNQYHISGAAVDPDDYEQFKLEWRQRHALVSLLCVFIDLKLIDNVNMEIAYTFMHLTNCRLMVDHGINMETRDWLRIMTFCKCLTLFYAVERAFFTNVTKEPKDFDITDILDCRPYLYCTREIFWYTLGQFQSSIMSPYLKLVMRGFQLASNNGLDDTPPEPEMVYDTVSATHKPSALYYFLDVQVTDKKIPFPHQVACRIKRALDNSNIITLSAEMIEDILDSNMNSTIVHDGLSLEKMTFRTMGKTGLRVCKKFYETVMNTEDGEFIPNLCKKTMDMFTPEYDYLLGTSDRLKNMSPFLFKTIRSQPNVSREEGGNRDRLRIPNVDYKPPSYNILIKNDVFETPEAAEVKKKKGKVRHLQSNIDYQVHQKVLNKLDVVKSRFPYTIDPKDVYTFDKRIQFENATVDNQKALRELLMYDNQDEFEPVLVQSHYAFQGEEVVTTTTTTTSNL